MQLDNDVDGLRRSILVARIDGLSIAARIPCRLLLAYALAPYTCLLPVRPSKINVSKTQTNCTDLLATGHNNPTRLLTGHHHTFSSGRSRGTPLRWVPVAYTVTSFSVALIRRSVPGRTSIGGLTTTMVQGVTVASSEDACRKLWVMMVVGRIVPV